MRRLAWMALLAAALPVSAIADSSLIGRAGTLSQSSGAVIGNNQSSLIFQGTFSGPGAITSVDRTTTAPSGRILSGRVIGSYNDLTIGAKTVEIKVGGALARGSTALGEVPEQGTLGLLGTGLLGIAGLVRRRSRAK